MSPFIALLRIELSRAFGHWQAVGLAAVALMGVVLAFWLPTFPQSVHLFFQHIFQLPTWPAIVFANDLAGIMSLSIGSAHSTSSPSASHRSKSGISTFTCRSL